MATLRLSTFVLMATAAGVMAVPDGVEQDWLALARSQAKQIEVQAKQIEALVGKQAMLEQRLLDAKATEKAVPAEEQQSERRLEEMTFQTTVTNCLDFMWIILCGALVMFMQAGFAVLEAGSVRQKNAGTVLLKNLVDVCLGTVAWYFVGYGLAYGVQEEPSTFAGSKYFAGGEYVTLDAEGGISGSALPKEWFFQWAFCATAATIVSGGVAERIRFPAYVCYSVLMTAFIYPVVVYWTWSGSGWLTEEGYSDFAGSGIVHLTGGIAALVGAVLCGPRVGRFEKPEEFAPHNMGLVVLGTFILWFGWYGFNCGSTLTFSSYGTAAQGGLVAMNTTLSAAAGGLTVLLLRFVEALAKKQEQLYDVAGMCNGILAGLVAVCAGVGSFEPGVAMLVGMLGAGFYEAGHWLLLLTKVDDPLDAFSVHGMAGMAGVLLRPLLDMTGGQGEMFVAHIYGLLAIVGWSGGLTLLILLPCRLLGLLTYGADEQLIGSDVHCSPNKAYSMEGAAKAADALPEKIVV